MVIKVKTCKTLFGETFVRISKEKVYGLGGRRSVRTTLGFTAKATDASQQKSGSRAAALHNSSWLKIVRRKESSAKEQIAPTNGGAGLFPPEFP
jgi:hypothetical protein